MENEKVTALNKLLKGTHMGASIFKDLREKLKSDMLKKEFDEILSTFRLHEKALTALIETEGGDPVDSAGFMGTITDMVGHLKHLSLDNDKEVLETAVENMRTASKAVNDFEHRHIIGNPNVEKTIHIMRDDYGSIFHKLDKYLIEFKFD